jgi:hypothetical protein
VRYRTVENLLPGSGETIAWSPSLNMRMTAITPRDLLRAKDVIDSFRAKMNMSVLQMNLTVHHSNGVIENA